MMDKNPYRHDPYYMDIAVTVRRRAKCLGRKVGAILVKDDRVVATGFNGTPSGMTNCTEGGCLRCASPSSFGPGEGYDLCLCVHAEANCLLMAAKFGVSVAGSTVYSTMQPCFSCIKEMYQAGVTRVVYLHPWEPANEQYREVYETFRKEAFPESFYQMGIGYTDPEPHEHSNYSRAIKSMKWHEEHGLWVVRYADGYIQYLTDDELKSGYLATNPRSQSFVAGNYTIRVEGTDEPF